MLIERFEGESKENDRCHQENDLNEQNPAIYKELGELAKFVEAMTRAIRDMEAPVATTTTQLPQANDFLADLSRMTEEGAHKVIALTEAIDGNRVEVRQILQDVDQRLLNQDISGAQRSLATAQKKLSQDKSRLLDISVALSFQDLVAQRVKKLVTILEDVQHKLLKLVLVFGLQQDQSKLQQDGRGHEMLKQLEASKKTSLDQGLVDDILRKCGFHT